MAGNYPKKMQNYALRGVRGVFAAPLIEFHYVTIHPDIEKLDTDEDALEVYGHVKVTNGNGDSFYLYDQPEDNTETMSPGDQLFLINTPPVKSPFPVTSVYFYLMDKTKGLELANQTLILDYREKSITFQEEGAEYVKGKDGFVNVCFTTFDAAVIADLWFKLYKKSDVSKIGGDDVYIVGRIDATCECDHSFGKGFNASLFWEDEPLLVKCGASIPVFKSLIAVPACSSLRLSASFRDVIDGVVTCSAAEVFTRKEIKGSADYVLDVFTEWLPGNPETEKLQKKLIGDDPPLPSSIKREPIPYFTSYFSADVLAEVYSMVILPDEKLNSNEDLNLYGFVDFAAPLRICRVFQRDKSSPIPFRRGEVKTLTISGPKDRLFPDSIWTLQVELKDIKGDIFCQGYSHLDCHDSWFHPLSFYNRRLCSIFKGDRGLVKVYHSIFYNAIQARVTVLSYFCESSRALDTDVSGSIVASYDGYAYDNQYDKDHYRNVLFSESRGSCSKISIGRGQQLPLLKSVISVPVNSALVIEFDLCARLEAESPIRETLKGLAKFEIGYKYNWKLQKKDFFFDVTVDWDKLK